MNKFAMPMVFGSILLGVMFGVLIATNTPERKSQTGIEWLQTPRPIEQYSRLLPVSDASIRLVLFGYLHCPDVCPTNLSELAALNQVLKNHGHDQLMEVLLVSVDPERDKGLNIEKYARQFDDNFSAIILTAEELALISERLGLRYRPPERDDDFYLVSHSPVISLVSQQGVLVGRLRSGFDTALVARQLTRQN